jgi:ribosomal protein S18 acetylase RimI-like enzyme
MGNREWGIGPLSAEHRERIESILRSAGVFNACEVDVALELFDATYGGGSSSDYSFLGAFGADGDLAGYACYGPTPATDRTFDLYWIATDATRQGKGVGSALMLEVEKRLEQERARLLVVETSSRSDYAQTRAFYGRHGYTESGRVRDYYAPEDDRVIFTKRFHLSPGEGGERGHK